VREPYGHIESCDSLEHFFYTSDMTKHLYNRVEYPGLVLALEQEKILKKMSNQNYKFQLTEDNGSGPFNKTIFINLIFLDDLTKTEYELVR